MGRYTGKSLSCHVVVTNMEERRTLLISMVLFFSSVYADVYLHQPRGSNNRLNEKSAARTNANRVFDSQNNNRGGYNAGDKTNKAFTNYAEQFHMEYFQSGSKYKTSSGNGGKSFLTVEWTNQHGCGGNEDEGPHKLNCNLVLQYLCQPITVSGKDQIRNGLNTQTQNYNRRNNGEKETAAEAANRKNGNVDVNKVLQEPWEWYDKCRNRERNQGLFTADQNLKGKEAIYTRQNPNGNRRGYECPEERDYFPYWHPTDWKDIAVLAENASMCNYYQKESFNVKVKYECMQKFPGSNQYRHWSKYNNEKDCKANGGEWLEFTNYLEKAKKYNSESSCNNAPKSNNIRYAWKRPHGSYNKECLVLLDAPDCKEADWSRDNHLGNGREGTPLNYTWTLPYFPSGGKQRCVLRLRYNITTDDYDPYKTNSSHNEDDNVIPPVQQNPEVDVGLSNVPLRLAINTAQFGRTFQDRSHVFHLVPRQNVPDDSVIHNVNVRGKRGNIVQTYPAVEYDFVPNNLVINNGELVHFQWTGSNTHNNGNPGGDGQTGNDGEGAEGTDKNNIVEIDDLSYNYPIAFEQSKMFKNADVIWTGDSKMLPSKYKEDDVAVSHASAGYYSCVTSARCSGNSLEAKTPLNNLLNNAPASYRGMLLRLAKGKYHYMCTRNNNFTNRSQKGSLEVR